ncbi:MAG: terminase small subunit [Polaromonas sp.]|nr:terminase small subunit [Polaromonas sp.]
MAKVNLMTMAAYARHRGVSKVAVGKAVKAGRISLVNGLIDPVVADMQWKANSRARASQHGGDQLPLDAATPADEPVKVDDYMYNRNRREAAEAERAELSLAEDKGQLIRVDAVKATLANVFSATRDALLQIPARLGPQLAAESDPAAAQTMLHAEIHQALQLLAGATARVGTAAVVTE